MLGSKILGLRQQYDSNFRKKRRQADSQDVLSAVRVGTGIEEYTTKRENISTTAHIVRRKKLNRTFQTVSELPSPQPTSFVHCPAEFFARAKEIFLSRLLCSLLLLSSLSLSLTFQPQPSQVSQRVMG